MIWMENELFAQFVLLSGLKIYFFWQKYTSQTKYFFGSLSNRSPCVVGSESDIQDAYRHILLNLKKEGATYLSEEFWIYEGQEKELAKMKEKDKKNEEEEKK